MWLGAALFFSAVVAPGAFAVMRSYHLANASEMAGAVVNRNLSAVNISGFVVGLLLLLTVFLPLTKGPFPSIHSGNHFACGAGCGNKCRTMGDCCEVAGTASGVSYADRPVIGKRSPARFFQQPSRLFRQGTRYCYDCGPCGVCLLRIPSAPNSKVTQQVDRKDYCGNNRAV